MGSGPGSVVGSSVPPSLLLDDIAAHELSLYLRSIAVKTRPRSSVLPSSVRVRPALDRDKEERRRKERRVPYTTSSSLLVLNCPSHAFCTEISGVSFNLYLCPARMSYVKDPFREREGEGTDPPLFERRDERRRRRRRRYLSGLKRAQRLSYVNEEENALTRQSTVRASACPSVT